MSVIVYLKSYPKFMAISIDFILMSNTGGEEARAFGGTTC